MLNSTLSFPSLVVDICRNELSLHDDTLAVAQALVGLTTDERLGDEQRQLLQHCRDVDTLQQADMRKDSDNYWRLLVTTAADIRVILILIARQLAMVRQHAALITPTNDSMTVAHDAAQLYAPIAHKLGLYQVKSELEDLAMKLTEHEAYYHIRAKLAATKQSREAYIQRFVAPLTARLLQTGLRFHIKGRTKSIHSIWQKMQKQQCPFEGVYDLFAIRIILNDETTDKQTLHSNTPTTLTLRKEKMQCWQAYSIVTDLYQPNTRRLRDWISVPKDNGYESLHITVRGPEQKRNGWRCRYAHSVWTTWLNEAWQHTGDIKEWRREEASTTGLTAYDNTQATTPLPIRERCMSSRRKATFGTSPKVPPCSTLPIAYTPTWATTAPAHALTDDWYPSERLCTTDSK